jgi:hypothetical protein
MSRDSTGNYSSPSGDFVTNTVIDSNVMNGKLQDLGTEITDSLSRSGKGGMTAPLRVADGTINLPAYAFTSETTFGLRRAGTTDLRVAKDGTDLFKWTATENRSLQAMKVSTGGLTVDAGGLTVTAGGGTITAGGLTVSAGGTAVTGTLPAQGGVEGASTFTASGAISTTSGQGHAITTLGHYIAGNTNNPVRLNMRTENADTVDEWQDVRVGLSVDVDSTVGLGGSALFSQREGLRIKAATAATVTDPTNAVELVNGNLKLSGTAPNADESLANTLTSANMVKAWANITTSPIGPTVTLNDGFNIASVAFSGGDVVVTIAGDMANTTYACHTEAFNSVAVRTNVAGKAAGNVTINAANVSTGMDYDLSANALTFDVTIVGRQS